AVTEHAENRPRIRNPIRQRIVGKLSFRISESPHIITAEPPALRLAPLNERVALVAPALRKKAGDEQYLTILADHAITANQLAVGACEFEQILPVHVRVTALVMNGPSRS